MHELILRFLDYKYGKRSDQYFEWSEYKIYGDKIIILELTLMDELTEKETDWFESELEFSMWDFMIMINAHLV